MAEVKRAGMTANTSCSIFNKSETSDRIFQILVDIGEGVINSMKNEIAELGFGSHVNIPCVNVPNVNLPDLLLITHSHSDHIKELPPLLSKASNHKSIKMKIMCTQRCFDQITQIFPNISEANKALFNIVTSGEDYSDGPFSITPVLTKHYNDNYNSSSSDSVIYVLKIADKKIIIIGWDFCRWIPELIKIYSGTQICSFWELKRIIIILKQE